ncbi:hypothetical protein [Christiangramia sabulilitoris]|uniref:Uncharacterized protein n=1 Tax=Christiangramia sabulilitoris TaxID=2583991 RepID=A0A550HZU9_9FLAO|nr:hypothetical protein [Christiangramia sabulilitoris]TRO64262.1 hypothetical protein FGM01_12255 [Christiangramia sabulilitoris]
MNIKFLRSAGRPGLYVSLALAGLLFVNCSKDDDTPPVYDFENEFEDLEELESVEDADPAITEPETGSVQESAVTTAVLADLGDGSGDVSAETQASLDAVESFGAGLSADAQAEADALDATRAEEILNLTDLGSVLSGVEASLDNAPAAVLELLPTIQFGAATTSAVFNVEFLKGFEGVDSKNSVDGVQQSSSCFEAAQKAYDDAMAPVIAKRQENLGIIDANYQRRLGEAEDRAVARLAAVDAAYDTYYNYILNTTIALLNYADAVEGTSPEFAANIRTYALIFIVQGSSNLTAWYAMATQAIVDAEAAEKQTAETLKTQRSAEVEARFAAIKAVADAKLTAAFNNCHNQGAAS